MSHKTPFIVAGVVLAVLSFGVLAAGGVALWADDKKDSSGFINTDAHEFETTSSALVTENMDLDLDGAGWLVQGDDFGKVRLSVDGAGSEPVFVGIAKTRDVERYLDGVAHSTVTDVDYGPFSASYSHVGGDRRPMPPANADIWDASAVGTGVQDLKWDVTDGDWSIVVMNADGSPGVVDGHRRRRPRAVARRARLVRPRWRPGDARRRGRADPARVPPPAGAAAPGRSRPLAQWLPVRDEVQPERRCARRTAAPTRSARRC